ncbi:MAG TPA: nuclear transport factor 2 family protein [Pyrinomonadaceae bacterium]|jgi:ketosteroid isomerase-like protein|nr:nuclear transport factor 2 family protein [Pyrinomonadaceae bacterium]
MMSTEDNKRVVQQVFEKFGSGDVPGLLAMIAEDAEWAAPGPEVVPYFGERRGRDGALEFFKQLGSNVEFERFEPGDFIAEGERVVVLGFERGRVRSTGKTFDNHWALVFTVRDGMVAGLRIYENNAAIAEAFS